MAIPAPQYLATAASGSLENKIVQAIDRLLACDLYPRNCGVNNLLCSFCQNFDISHHTYVNMMPQYRPCGTVSELDRLSRTLSDEEYLEAVPMTEEIGIHRFDVPRAV